MSDAPIRRVALVTGLSALAFMAFALMVLGSGGDSDELGAGSGAFLLGGAFFILAALSIFQVTGGWNLGHPRPSSVLASVPLILVGALIALVGLLLGGAIVWFFLTEVGTSSSSRSPAELLVGVVFLGSGIAGLGIGVRGVQISGIKNRG